MVYLLNRDLMIINSWVSIKYSSIHILLVNCTLSCRSPKTSGFFLREKKTRLNIRFKMNVYRNNFLKYFSFKLILLDSSFDCFIFDYYDAQRQFQIKAENLVRSKASVNRKYPLFNVNICIVKFFRDFKKIFIKPLLSIFHLLLILFL